MLNDYKATVNENENILCNGLGKAACALPKVHTAYFNDCLTYRRNPKFMNAAL